MNLKNFISKPFFFLISLLYLPSFFTYFSADDWFHLRVSQINSLSQFFNFFSINSTAQSTPFYRPISTQVPFFISQQLFSLHPFFYHLIIFSLFLISLKLIYDLIYLLTRSSAQANLTLLFYTFSITNFTRLYYISAGFQELLLLVLLLLAFKNYFSTSKTHQLLSYLCFTLALLCKEQAVIFPAILLLALLLFSKKLSFTRLFPYFLLTLAYLFILFTRLNFIVGDSTYKLDFSPHSIINTLMWYSFWALGAPEFLVDYIGSGLRPIPRFFTDFPFSSYLILLGLLSTIILVAILIYKNRSQLLNPTIIFSLGLFFLGLGPLLFLPQHKFTIQMALPLIGSSLFLTTLVSRSKALKLPFISLFLLLNLGMQPLLYQHHYTVSRAAISRKIVSYLNHNFPQYPEGSALLFTNDTPDFGQDWGSSKQIAHATDIAELFRTYYHQPNLNIYFADFPPPAPPDTKVIFISSQQFLQP